MARSPKASAPPVILSSKKRIVSPRPTHLKRLLGAAATPATKSATSLCFGGACAPGSSTYSMASSAHERMSFGASLAQGPGLEQLETKGAAIQGKHEANRLKR